MGDGAERALCGRAQRIAVQDCLREGEREAGNVSVQLPPGPATTAAHCSLAAHEGCTCRVAPARTRTGSTGPAGALPAAGGARPRGTGRPARAARCRVGLAGTGAAGPVAPARPRGLPACRLPVWRPPAGGWLVGRAARCGEMDGARKVRRVYWASGGHRPQLVNACAAPGGGTCSRRRPSWPPGLASRRGRERAVRCADEKPLGGRCGKAVKLAWGAAKVLKPALMRRTARLCANGAET